MKLFETLKDNDIRSILDGEITGIFSTLITQNDAWYENAADICNIYYIHRSGNKTISPLYERYIELLKTHPYTTKTAEQIVGEVVRGKFINKWNKVYTSLVETEYSPVDDFSRNEQINAEDTTTNTYNTTITDDGTTAVKETVARDGVDDDRIYGFNTVEPVGDTKSLSNSTVTTTANANDNTTHNTETKTGTDSKSHNVDESKNINGRNTSAQELIMKELDLRNREVFFDIMFKDIDSIVTLAIY